MSLAGNIAFIQSFGISSPGGGSRILRALVQDSPWDIVSLVTQPNAPVPTSLVREIHLPYRPNFGRLEKTRFANLLNTSESFYARRFRRKLRQWISENRLDAIHGTIHTISCLDAFEVSKEFSLPFFLSIHDDFAYILQRRIGQARSLDRLAEAWNGSRARFVISREMGEEYSLRYGRQSYTLVSDGVEQIANAVKETPSRHLRIYFMGLFHQSYIPNLEALLAGLSRYVESNPLWTVSVTCRCGQLPPIKIPNGIKLTILPFASESEVAKDMESADVLYQPLPFDEKHSGLVRFSLSTKMVTYLGSGLLILYHGPLSSAAGQLLSKNNAAICIDSLEESRIVQALDIVKQKYAEIVTSALSLAKTEFCLNDIRQRFWRTIIECS